MLIEFSVENFLSFRKKATLSMVASAITEKYKDNVFSSPINQIDLLKSIAVYGANASGKSNLFKGLRLMKYLVLNSAKDLQIGDKLNIDPFKLNSEDENKPSTFEVIFIVNKIRYRYGFEADNQLIYKEWLYYVPTIREAKLFERNRDEISTSVNFKEGKGLKEKTRSNALFLSVVAQFNGGISKQLLNWFRNVHIIGEHDSFHPLVFELFKEESGKDIITHILKIADMGIEDLSLLETKLNLNDPRIPDVVKENIRKRRPSEKEIQSEDSNYVYEMEIKSIHSKYDGMNKYLGKVEFDFDKNESRGTRKLLGLIGPFVKALISSSILIIDEFETALHPIITRYLISIFNSIEMNNLNAQLLFTTHDTSLLDKKYLRRDQIWFTEKDKFGASSLFSLYDFNIRNDASYGKDYISGKYGAIPYINAESLTAFYPHLLQK